MDRNLKTLHDSYFFSSFQAQNVIFFLGIKNKNVLILTIGHNVNKMWMLFYVKKAANTKSTYCARPPSKGLNKYPCTTYSHSYYTWQRRELRRREVK